MLLKKIIPWLIGCVAIYAACFASKEFGYQQGVADTTQKNLANEIGLLNESLNVLAEQTKKAGELNLVLHNTISQRQRADQQSTQVFVNALNATAHLRFDCRFDDNIMQQIFQTADRADQAAASGFGSALPASATPDG